MSLWLLIVTVIFLEQPMTFDLPSETIFQSPERCYIAGKYVSDSLAQDGMKVSFKCVEIPR